jgi:hypothetical protein
MDALKRDATVLRALLLDGAGTTIALLAFAALGFLFVLNPGPDSLVTFYLCMGVVAAAFVFRAAVRVSMCCYSAGHIGIPHHVDAIQRAQIFIVAAFVLIPTVLSLLAGGDWRALVIFVAVVGLAIRPMEQLSLVFIGLLAIKALVSTTHLDLWSLAFGAPGVVTVLVLSAWSIADWLKLPRRIEILATAGFATLADASHETDHAVELDARSGAFEREFADVLAPRQPDVISPRRLWLGMGFDTRTPWRGRALELAIAVAVLAAAHVVKDGRWDLNVYLLASAYAGTLVFGRFQSLHQGWLVTPGEQSLLLLAPRWPARAALKQALLRSAWSGLPIIYAGWALLSLIAVALQYVSWRMVLLALLGHAAVLISSLGIFLSYFSRSRLRATNWLQMAYLLIAFVGTVCLIAGAAFGSLMSTLIGTAMVLAPFLIALLAFSTCRLLFPVERPESAPL